MPKGLKLHHEGGSIIDLVPYKGTQLFMKGPYKIGKGASPSREIVAITQCGLDRPFSCILRDGSEYTTDEKVESLEG